MTVRPRPRSGGIRPPAPHGRRVVGNSQGFVVFGALILVVVVVIAAVLLGKVVRYRYPDTHAARFEQRQLRYVVAPVEVRDEKGAATRLEPGDSVWVHLLVNGDVVVFRDREGDGVLGLAPASAFSPVRPAPAP